MRARTAGRAACASLPFVPERDFSIDSRDAPQIVTTLYRVAAMLTAQVDDPARLTDIQVQALSPPGYPAARDRLAAAANLRRAARAIEDQMDDDRARKHPNALRAALANGLRMVAAACVVAASVSAGGPSSVADQARPANAAGASQQLPFVMPRREDHPEQPHGPEVDAAELPSQETEVLERHVLVLDDPKYGVLNGQNYLGYCETCPLIGQICHGPCPGYDMPGGYASMQTPPAD